MLQSFIRPSLVNLYANNARRLRLICNESGPDPVSAFENERECLQHTAGNEIQG